MTFTPPTDGYGIYEGINTLSNAATYQPRLQTIAQAGFKLVMNYNLLHGHIADVIAYINYAGSQGMKVMVYLADTNIWKTNTISTRYPELYADSGNAATGILFMQYIVAQTKNLAGVWGWYVGDEVAAADHATLKSYTDAIRTADATHPRLFIAAGNDATNSFGASNSLFWDCCDAGGDDYYCVGTTAPITVASLSTEAAAVQAYCTTKSISSAIALQAHSLNGYGIIGAPWPTASQMVQMRSNALNNMTARVVLWYSYFDVIATGSPTFAPVNQWYYLENASEGRTGLTLFPTAKRRGSPDQSNFYKQSITADAPMAYYRMDESSGIIAHDSTSNHYDGTIRNDGSGNLFGVTLSQSGAINQDVDTSMLFFNNGFITLPVNLNGSGLSAFSVELWFNPSSFPGVGGFANILMGDTTVSNHSYQLYLINGPPNKLVFSAGNGTTNVTAIDVPLIPYAINTWYQAVGSFDGSFIYLSVNGIIRASSALAGTIGTSVVTPVIASSTAHSSAFSGKVDEVSFYNYVLGSKVPAHYAASLRAPSTAALFPTATRRQS